MKLINLIQFKYYRNKGRKAARRYQQFIQYLTPTATVMAQIEKSNNIHKFIDEFFSNVSKCKKELKYCVDRARYFQSVLKN